MCRGCKKSPNELEEYVEMAKEEGSGISPTLWMQENEGTYEADSMTFLCTECYVARGCPVYRGGTHP